MQHIIVLRLPATPTLGLNEPSTYLLVDIRPCRTNLTNTPLNVPCYREYRPAQVVDMTCVQCLVGRIKFLNGGLPTWAIIDRSSELNRAIWADETV